MKVFRFFLCLALLVGVVGWAYAYFYVKDRESTRTSELIAQIEGISGDATRGEYVAAMGGCIACHTHVENGGELLAGGVPIETPYGTFYSPNITRHDAAGIGQWTSEEFVLAMSVGTSPNKQHYYPAFPYPSYSVMSVQDLVDLKAWIDTVESVAEPAPEHDLTWPFSVRSGLLVWKALFFDYSRTMDLNDRGNYLVNGPGHCAECHSPRNLLGGLSARSLSGNTRGPDGESVPGITLQDLSEWSIQDLELFLEVGITPSGDFTGGHMSDVIEYSTSLINEADRNAIARYLLSETNNP